MLLKDRTAIVYGGGGAVGGAVAKAFAREGARVFIAGHNETAMLGVADAIGSAGGRAEIGSVDATDPASIEAHLERVVGAAGPVKVMFNAVGWGGSQGQLLTEMDFDRFFGSIEIALRTWFHTGTIMARHMGQNGGGAIVGITANSARQAFPYTGGFSVTCAAVEHFLRHLGVENGPQGVRVCWVRSPGSPDAPGVRAAWQLRADEWGMSFEEVHTLFAKDTPLRRVTALAQVADAAVLLASDLAAGMTATVANATGGAQVD
jgi:NAD(P)-dependent dehydrogenase (short-subunit alcohol dehydrogenase family)